MKDQINTIRAALDIMRGAVGHEENTHTADIALTALAQLEAAAGEPFAYCYLNEHGEPAGYIPAKLHTEASKDIWPIPLYRAAPVAQQPQEIEVQCPVCNHKFYEWPNDKQPQAEAVPAVDRVYEAAKRLVDHADFQLGGVLSAKSKARDIPSNAASKVKARHLASLRDALAKTPQQAEAVPPDVVRDAAPIPDHELVTMYDERPTSDLEMIEFAREVERRHGIGVQPQHITDGSPCWCNPDVAYTDPETSASVIVHRRPQ